MFLKLFTIIMSFSVVAAMLLVNRQHRIDAAHQMSTIHQRLVDHETSLWKLRADIAHRCRPEAIQQLVQNSEVEWQPVPDRTSVLLERERDARFVHFRVPALPAPPLEDNDG